MLQIIQGTTAIVVKMVCVVNPMSNSSIVKYKHYGIVKAQPVICNMSLGLDAFVSSSVISGDGPT